MRNDGMMTVKMNLGNQIVEVDYDEEWSASSDEAKIKQLEIVSQNLKDCYIEKQKTTREIVDNISKAVIKFCDTIQMIKPIIDSTFNSDEINKE